MTPGFVGADGAKLEHAWVAITIDHATGTTVAHRGGGLPLFDVAERSRPMVAAVESEVPVEIEILVAGQAAEPFRLAPEVAAHVGQRGGGVEDQATAVVLEALDAVEDHQQFPRGVADRARAAVAQAARGQGRDGVTEGATGEAEGSEELGQPLIVLDQLAGRDAGGGLQTTFGEELVGAGQGAAIAGQTPVRFMLGGVMGVQRHDDTAQAVGGELADGPVRPELAVGADHGMQAPLRRVAHHGQQVGVEQWFAPDKQQVANVVAHRQVHHPARLG